LAKWTNKGKGLLFKRRVRNTTANKIYKKLQPMHNKWHVMEFGH